MNPGLQMLLAAALSAALFGSGFFVGNSRSRIHVEVEIPGPIALSHIGLPSERVDCVQWVTKNYKGIAAGMVASICGGN